MSPRILVACIGNLFLGDDGFGVEAARSLTAANLGPDVKVIDYGIRGLDLAYALLDRWESVVLVDAVARGEKPGTLYLLRPGSVPGQSGLDPHSMDPVRVLATARSLGKVTADLYLIGCEPLDFGDEVEGRMGLSHDVSAAIPEAVSMVRELVAKLHGDAVVAHR